MSAGGHIADMIARMKANRKQRPSNRKKFKGNQRAAAYSESKFDLNHLHEENYDSKILEKQKNEIKQRLKRQRNKAILLTTLVLVCIVILIAWLIQ